MTAPPAVRSAVERPSKLTRRLVTAVVFTSMAGQTFVLLGLSAAVFERFDSAFLSGAVFATQWALALLALPLAARLHHRLTPKGAFIAAESGAAVLTLLAGLAGTGAPVLMYAALLVRGLCAVLSYTAATLYLKAHLPAPGFEGRVAVFETGRFGGSALASMVALFGLGSLSPAQFGIAGAATVLVGVGLAAGWATVPRTGDRQRVRQLPLMVAIFRERSPVRTLFLLLTVIVAFQAFHHVARNPLAIDTLKLGPSGPAVIAVVNTTAVTIGAWATATLLSRSPHRMPSALVLVVTAAAFMVVAPLGLPAPVSLATYFSYLFVFEAAFTAFNARMLASATEAQVLTVTPLRTSALPIVLMAETLGLGLVADAAGILVTACLVGAAAIAGTFLIVRGPSRRTFP
jgi:hypothetical protein